MYHRQNRIIEQSKRGLGHQRLAYNAIPHIMMCYPVMDCTHKPNMFPAKGGISKYYSPKILLGQRALD